MDKVDLKKLNRVFPILEKKSTEMQSETSGLLCVFGMALFSVSTVEGSRFPSHRVCSKLPALTKQPSED